MPAPLLSAVRPVSAPLTTRDGLTSLLTLAAERGATEVHLKVPNAPVMRIRGTLVPAGSVVLAPQDTASILDHLVVMSGIAMTGRPASIEFAFGLSKVGRFHVFVYRQRGTYAIVIRRMELEAPTLPALGLDPQLDVGAGLSLLVGPHRAAGMHAAVCGWNHRRGGHVVVLESPLQVLHRDNRAFISQREVGNEVADFPTGIREAVRMGCDLLCVGDLPDRAAVDAALDAAERDVPVLVCIAAHRIEEAPWWLARQYDGRRRDDAEQRIANVIRAVWCPVRA